MFWSKKEEKKSLPDLPPLKSPFTSQMSVPPEHSEPENDKEEHGGSAIVERHNLPSFPDSPIEKGFSQAAIKDAISHEEAQEGFSLIKMEAPKKFKTIEMEESAAAGKYQPSPVPAAFSAGSSSLQLGPPPSLELEKNRQPSYQSSPHQKSSDIFIKIDKFNSAKRALSSAQDQLDHIDSLLKKVRDVKMREEQELAAWEKEMTNVKARIKDINENIFEKLE